MSDWPADRSRERRLRTAAAAAGAALALTYTLSPLTVIATMLAAALLWWAGRGLPPNERQVVRLLVAAAIVVRVAIVAALFLGADHDSQAAAILVPDEAYTLGRTLRIRGVLLGIPALKYDYAIAFEDYGRTSFLWFVTALQVLFGPSPYGLRLIDAALFLAGAILLFRLARRAYGPLPAAIGLATLLFMPTWLFWSVSLLKESLYFVLTTVALTAATALLARVGVRDAALWPNSAGRAGTPVTLAFVVGIVALLLRDLRTGAVVLLLSGLGLGAALFVMLASRRRVVLGAAVASVAVALTVTWPGAQQQMLTGLTLAAREHIGHVFTVGHSYKTLDEELYLPVNHDVTLTASAAARFAIRSLVSFMVVPLPHQISTRGEIAQLPEHLLWYVLIALAPFGIAAGLRLDRALTCLLVGYMVPTAVIVALTNGNVGTLVRFRGLVTPYLIWLAALGFCVIMQRLAVRSRTQPFGVRPLAGRFR